MEPSQTDTLEAVCAWSDFTPEWAGPLLRYLVANAGPDSRYQRTQKAIAEVVFPGQDVDTLNIPLRIARINSKLEQFFKGPGGKLQWRLHVNTAPRGKATQRDHYEVIVERAHEAVLRRFWEPHLLPDVPTRFAYGEPLFAQDHEGLVYTRDVRKNEPHNLAAGESVAYPFITLGDLALMWDIGHYLLSRGVPVERSVYRHESKLRDLKAGQSVRDENLLVLGTPRSNGAITEYQKDYPFVFTIDELAIRGPHGKKFVDKDLPKRTDLRVAYAIIGRRPGIQIGTVTIIASNNGRAIEKAADLLTSDTQLKEFVEREPRLSFFNATLPASFQFLIRFELTDHGTFVRSFSVVDSWINERLDYY